MRIVPRQPLPLAPQYKFVAAKTQTIIAVGGPFIDTIYLSEPFNVISGVEYQVNITKFAGAYQADISEVIPPANLDLAS